MTLLFMNMLVLKLVQISMLVRPVTACFALFFKFLCFKVVLKYVNSVIRMYVISIHSLHLLLKVEIWKWGGFWFLECLFETTHDTTNLNVNQQQTVYYAFTKFVICWDHYLYENLCRTYWNICQNFMKYIDGRNAAGRGSNSNSGGPRTIESLFSR